MYQTASVLNDTHCKSWWDGAISYQIYSPSRHMTTNWNRIDVDPTSIRHIGVKTTSFQRCLPSGMLLNHSVFLGIYHPLCIWPNKLSAFLHNIHWIIPRLALLKSQSIFLIYSFFIIIFFFFIFQILRYPGRTCRPTMFFLDLGSQGVALTRTSWISVWVRAILRLLARGSH